MIDKHALLLALLIPGLIGLAACSRNDHDGDDVGAPVATATPAPADNMQTQPIAANSGASMSTGEMAFADMDKNHDGSVTDDELSAANMLHQHFSVADADGDSKLSEAEVMKHRADMAAAPPAK